MADPVGRSCCAPKALPCLMSHAGATDLTYESYLFFLLFISTTRGTTLTVSLGYWTSTMTQGTRFLALAIPIILTYLLALFNILPVPLLSTEVANQILPVVRCHVLELWLIAIAALVASRFFRRLLSHIPWSWTSHFQRLSGSVQLAPAGKLDHSDGTKPLGNQPS